MKHFTFVAISSAFFISCATSQPKGQLAEAPNAACAAPIELTINDSGVYGVDRTRHPITNLEAFKAGIEALHCPSDTLITLTAHAETPHHDFIQVLDVVAQLGFKKVSITTVE